MKMFNFFIKMQKTIYILIIQILFVFSVLSQEKTIKNAIPSTIDSLKTEKNNPPSLSVFIESALKNSPLLNVSEREIDILLEEIKIKKKSWLQFISFDLNTKYGLYNQLSINEEISSENPDVAIQSNKEQFNYYAGLSIRLPLATFTNRNNELKIIKGNIKINELKKEQLKKEISTFIIEEYYKLINFKDNMTLDQNTLQIMKIIYLKSEKEVENGILRFEDFSTISGKYFNAEQSFSKSKNEYKSQLYKLQILTGLNIEDLSK